VLIAWANALLVQHTLGLSLTSFPPTTLRRPGPLHLGREHPFYLPF
jgi:hypothetical protein